MVLLRRDHHDLERGLAELLYPDLPVHQMRSTLDGIRLGLTAHAEAEDIVLYRAAAHSPQLEELVAEARAAHLAQEGALASLVCATPGSSTWRDRALMLRKLVHDHALYEEEHLLPRFRTLAPEHAYGRLAGAFATERLRQLAMLQPSAPIVIAELAQAS